MDITETSKSLISFFIDKKCILYKKQTTQTKDILLKLYDNINKADLFIKSCKKEEGDNFFKLNIKKVTQISQIPNPKTFNINSFPDTVKDHINKTSTFVLTYTFSLFDRDIIIHFVIEDKSKEVQHRIYNEYIEKILVWLYVINLYSSKTCCKKIEIFLYLTLLKKELPKNNIIIIDQIHVNTGFTYTCPINSEIVIFRKEEWFKVLIHESIHNFALDFSNMNNSDATKNILSFFKISSDVNLYEAYTEFWAEIMNVIFCSYFLNNAAKNKKVFLTNFDFFINTEITFKFFQMIKILKFMGLSYRDLYSNDNSILLKQQLYKEKTNVLAYYIITTILMNSYQDFLSWCNSNNNLIIHFKKTPININNFCKFIEHNYKTDSMISHVDCIHDFLNKLKKNKSLSFVLNNMRMTLCELG